MRPVLSFVGTFARSLSLDIALDEKGDLSCQVCVCCWLG